jgi:predicted ATPase
MMRKIVLTGGPGAGKTVISMHLAALHGISRVPEAATAVYTQMQTRWDRLDIAGRRLVQRRIYEHQLELENSVAQSTGKTILLDRGTLDGATYWPDGPDDYWQQLGTTRQAEMNRYYGVIWLESSAALGLYDGDSSNTRRHEDAQGAIAAGERLLALWEGHPRLKRVAAEQNLETKIQAVDHILSEWI